MQTEFSLDPKPTNHDALIEEAFLERPGKAVRVRLQPQILRGRGRDGQYQVWPDVRWTIECDTPQECFELREAMRVFFRTLGEHGAEGVIKALGAARKEAA